MGGRALIMAGKAAEWWKGLVKELETDIETYGS